MRDLIKRGICAERGIRLIVVHAEDLTLAGMQRKLAELNGLIPLRSLEGKEQLIARLEALGRTCRRTIARGNSAPVGAR